MADGPLTIVLDISSLIAANEKIANEIEQRTSEMLAVLSAQTHAHIIEEAQTKLKTRREQFVSKLKLEQLDESIWAITIPKEVVWIEDGVPTGFDMLPGFLASPKAKSGKNGKYLVIPFKHNKAPSQTTEPQKVLANEIKKELKKRNTSATAIEKNPDGSPKLGLIHKFNIDNPQQKNQVKPPNQGAQGRPWQAHSRPTGQEGAGGRPFLWGVRVYQNEIKKPDGSKSVKKDVLTFRTASEKQSNKWKHSGLAPMNFLEDAQEWALKQWDELLLPTILREFGLEDE